MQRWWTLVLVGCLGIAGWLGWPDGVLASVLCRDVTGQQVCIESIKRSAKYPWEYRVVATVDGKQQPMIRYDCRPTSQETAEADPVQQLVCGLVKS